MKYLMITLILIFAGCVEDNVTSSPAIEEPETKYVIDTLLITDTLIINTESIDTLIFIDTLFVVDTIEVIITDTVYQYYDNAIGCLDPEYILFEPCKSNSETGHVLCQDNYDNDSDGKTDCEEDSCIGFSNC